VPSSIEGFIIEISQVMFLIITYIMRLWWGWGTPRLLTNYFYGSIIKKIELNGFQW
jgi:hypothetical protein